MAPRRLLLLLLALLAALPRPAIALGSKGLKKKADDAAGADAASSDGASEGAEEPRSSATLCPGSASEDRGSSAPCFSTAPSAPFILRVAGAKSKWKGEVCLDVPPDWSSGVAARNARAAAPHVDAPTGGLARAVDIASCRPTPTQAFVAVRPSKGSEWAYIRPAVQPKYTSLSQGLCLSVLDTPPTVVQAKLVTTSLGTTVRGAEARVEGADYAAAVRVAAAAAEAAGGGGGGHRRSLLAQQKWRNNKGSPRASAAAGAAPVALVAPALGGGDGSADAAATTTSLDAPRVVTLGGPALVVEPCIADGDEFEHPDRLRRMLWKLPADAPPSGEAGGLLLRNQATNGTLCVAGSNSGLSDRFKAEPHWKTLHELVVAACRDDAAAEAAAKRNAAALGGDLSATPAEPTYEAHWLWDFALAEGKGWAGSFDDVVS